MTVAMLKRGSVESDKNMLLFFSFFLLGHRCSSSTQTPRGVAALVFSEGFLVDIAEERMTGPHLLCVTATLSQSWRAIFGISPRVMSHSSDRAACFLGDHLLVITPPHGLVLLRYAPGF